jgi:hypothetical protein
MFSHARHAYKGCYNTWHCSLINTCHVCVFGFVYPRHRKETIWASIYFIYNLLKKGELMFNYLLLYPYMCLCAYHIPHDRVVTTYNLCHGRKMGQSHTKIKTSKIKLLKSTYFKIGQDVYRSYRLL